MSEFPLEISIEDAAALLPPSTEVAWLDCREPDEWNICRIEGAQLQPLSTFAETAEAALPNRGQRVIVYCHHGMRSQRAAQWLRSRGYHSAQSMAGGIDRWAEVLDPAMRRY
jgi:rhodanese-related sulfurtransferase